MSGVGLSGWAVGLNWGGGSADGLEGAGDPRGIQVRKARLMGICHTVEQC